MQIYCKSFVLTSNESFKYTENYKSLPQWLLEVSYNVIDFLLNLLT